MVVKKKDKKVPIKDRNKNVTHGTKIVPIREEFTNVKRGKGRPQKEIDLNAVEELAGYGCIKTEIATYLGCSHDTLSRRPEVEEAYQKGLDRCKRSIRRKQYDAAMEGDKTMLVWLGKILCGQREQTEQKLTIEGGKNPVKIMPVQERIREYEALFEGTT